MTTAASKAQAAVQRSVGGSTEVGFKKSSDVQDLLIKYLPQFTKIVTQDLTPERWIQIFVTVVGKNPDLMKCTGMSLVGAALQAASLGFNPNPVLGHCYFVPYKNWKNDNKMEIQFQIGYKGYMNLARKSGEIREITSMVVKEGDEFTVEYGLNPKLVHIPNLESDGKTIFAYAVAHFLNGGFNFVVMNRKQIEHLRKTSPAQKDTPGGVWKEWYDKMAMAKAIKQLVPFLPLKDEVAARVAMDDAVVIQNDDIGGQEAVYVSEEPAAVVEADPLPEKKPRKKAVPAPEEAVVVDEGQPQKSAEELNEILREEEKKEAQKKAGDDSGLFPDKSKSK